MKIALLEGYMQNYNLGLPKITNLVKEILTELGVEIVDINLAFSQIPYYDGIKSNATQSIISKIEECNAVIIATTSQMKAPAAITQTFIEHMTGEKDVLLNKNCMIICVSSEHGEKECSDYLSSVVNYLGGFDSQKIAVNSISAIGIDINKGLHEIIEKQVEDFFRFAKQNRKFIIHRPENLASVSKLTRNDNDDYAKQITLSQNINNDVKPIPSPALKFNSEISPNNQSIIDSDFAKTQQKAVEILKDQSLNKLYEKPIKDEFITEVNKPTFEYVSLPDENLWKEDIIKEDVIKEVDLGVFSETEEKEIDSISKMFAEKYLVEKKQTQTENTLSPLENLDIGGNISVNREKNCRQLTKSLPHYFNSQYATGIENVIQLNISGEDGFNGFLNIENNESEYYDGDARNPDITIISDSELWKNVVTGKISAQKAFMVGKLKVRGNFMLLSKFDQLFIPVEE